MLIRVRGLSPSCLVGAEPATLTKGGACAQLFFEGGHVVTISEIETALGKTMQELGYLLSTQESLSACSER